MTGYSLLFDRSDDHVQFVGPPLGPVASWVCSECLQVLPGQRLRDVRLNCIKLGPQPLMGSFSFGHQVVRRAFLEVLCAGKIDREFEWASVLAPNGEPFEDWLIAVGRHHIHVRGQEELHCDFCPVCERSRYFTADQAYLYPAPRQDIDIFDAGSASLVVTDKILNRVRSRKWPKLGIKKLTIAKEDPDGFGEIPRQKPSGRRDRKS